MKSTKEIIKKNIQLDESNRQKGTINTGYSAIFMKENFKRVGKINK